MTRGEQVGWTEDRRDCRSKGKVSIMGRAPGRAAWGHSTREMLHVSSFHSAGVSGSKSVFKSYPEDRQVSQEALLAAQGHLFPGFGFDNRP